MKERFKLINYTNLILISYCFVIFSYVFYRAYNLSFTFDEVTTSQIVNGDDWMNFGSSANNHFLNVLLIKGVLILFKPSELVYRLPNLLGFVLYLIYAVKIGKFLNQKSPYISLILLTSMPFVIDFFGLARGYGLSLSFILPSIYFLLKYCQKNHLLFGVMSLLFGILAVLSNFTSLNYFLPLIIILFLFTFFSKENICIKLYTLTIITACFFYFIIPVVFQLKSRGELYFGGRTNFYEDTILTLSRTFAYHQLNIGIANIIFTLLFGLATIFSIIEIFKFIRKRSFDFKIIIPILFVTSILSPIAQNIIFETNFPSERTAVLYYPILILVFLNSINSSSSWFFNGGLKLLSFTFLIHLIFTFNVTYCYSWRYDSGSKEVSIILKEESSQKIGNQSISLGIDYLFTPSVWYYSFGNLQTQEVVRCWEFDMHLEELEPKYYGNSIVRKDKLSHEDAERIYSTNLDYYYLNDFVVNELIRLGYSVQIKKKFEMAGSSLIKLQKLNPN